MKEIDVGSERSSGASATAKFSIGETLPELVEQFTEEVVYSHVRRSLIIALQAFMRSLLDSGKSAEEIQQAVTEWKPGLKKPGKSPLERAREELARMSPADRKALAQEIRSRRDGDAASA